MSNHHQLIPNENETRLPGVPGTVKPLSINPQDFEALRRDEAKRLAGVFKSNSDTSGPSEEELAKFNSHKIMKSTMNLEVKPGEERSVCHYKTNRLGNTYLDLPDGAPDYYRYRPDSSTELQCHLPKQPIHILLGHSKGVASIQFNQVYPHVLLSGGLDCRVKLWSVISAQCLRTLIGHDRPIRQASFEQQEGIQLLTLSADKFIKLWNVETGNCTLSLEQKRIPTCSQFVNRNTLLTGLADGRVQLWDIRSHKAMIREFWHHTDAISTITSLNSDTFATTSEDRTVKVWELRDSVPRAVLSKPEVCEVFAATVKHPCNDTILCSALSSELVSFKFDPNDFSLKRRARHLIGHKSAGMIVKPAFSADGRFVAAGDGVGALHAWDWTSGQSARVIEAAHDQPITDCAFSFADPRLLATSSLDASIKLWS